MREEEATSARTTRTHERKSVPTNTLNRLTLLHVPDCLTALPKTYTNRFYMIQRDHDPPSSPKTD